jgi:hypothetical protein
LDETVELRIFENSTQVASALGCHGVRRINGREPLIDYFQNHVVAIEKYLRIMRQKKWIGR